ncbi:MMPL family transporter [Stappia sp.]|uniref:efflux RND transporter permease subunit n=1 Tax=Stappia sp. TaxID=1870903 RepID=UPI0032D8DCFF
MRVFAAIEAAVSWVLCLIYNHRLKMLPLVLLALAGYIVANLPNIEKDGRVEAFMHAEAPALETYYDMRREFGQDNRLIISVTGPDVFDTDFLTKFSEFHTDIAHGVPHVAEIFSPYNIPFIEYEDGGVYLEELVRNMLVRGRDPRELRDRIVETPLYRNFIISADGQAVSIVVEPYRYAPDASDCTPDPANGVRCPIVFTPLSERTLLGAPQYTEMTAAARDIAAEYQGEGFDISIAGAPVVSTEIVRMMEQDMPRFTLACLIITVITMLVLHRSVLIGLGAFVNFLTGILTTLATVSAVGVAVTPPVQLLIPMTLVVGLCTYVHFTAALLKARARESTGPGAIRLAVSRSNTPILFTALTTAGGLTGLIASPLAPITDLGLFGLVSVGASYLLSLFWVTIIFRTLPTRFLERQQAEPGRIARIMAGLAAASAARPYRVLACAAAVLVIAAAGMTRLDYSHNSLLWLPESNPARVSTEAIDARFNGTVNLEMVISPTGQRDFRDAGILKAIDATSYAVYDDVDVPIGRHTSIISFIEETNQAINDGDPAALRLPEQEAIWDQILLLEGQGIDDMKRYVSMDYSTGRVSFQTPWLEAKLYADVVETIQTEFQAALGDQARVEATGLIVLLAQTSKAVLDSMSRSYLIALIVVTAFMAIALRSAKLGLLSIVPNVVPFVMLLGIMGFLRLPLDTFTVLIGGIITGLIVDDTLHFFHALRQRMDDRRNIVDAVREGVHEIGGALFATTLVVMLSFAVFGLSTMSNIQTFGALMVMGAAIALLAEMTIGPAILALYHRANQRADKPVGETAYRPSQATT